MIPVSENDASAALFETTFAVTEVAVAGMTKLQLDVLPEVSVQDWREYPAAVDVITTLAPAGTLLRQVPEQAALLTVAEMLPVPGGLEARVNAAVCCCTFTE